MTTETLGPLVGERLNRREDLVVAYLKWSLTRVEPQESHPELGLSKSDSREFIAYNHVKYHVVVKGLRNLHTANIQMRQRGIRRDNALSDPQQNTKKIQKRKIDLALRSIT